MNTSLLQLSRDVTQSLSKTDTERTGSCGGVDPDVMGRVNVTVQGSRTEGGAEEKMEGGEDYGFYGNATIDDAHGHDGLFYSGAPSTPSREATGGVSRDHGDTISMDDHPMDHSDGALSAGGRRDGMLAIPYTQAPVVFEDSELYESARFVVGEYDYDPSYLSLYRDQHQPYRQHHPQQQQQQRQEQRQNAQKDQTLYLYQEHLISLQQQMGLSEEPLATEPTILIGSKEGFNQGQHHRASLQLSASLLQEQQLLHYHQESQQRTMDVDDDMAQEEEECGNEEDEEKLEHNDKTIDSDGDEIELASTRKRKATSMRQQSGGNRMSDESEDASQGAKAGTGDHGSEVESKECRLGLKRRRKSQCTLSRVQIPQRHQQQMNSDFQQLLQQHSSSSLSSSSSSSSSSPSSPSLSSSSSSALSSSSSATSTSAHCSNFITEHQFLRLAEDYLLSLSPKKREKALLSNSMYQKILMVLIQPKNTQVSTAQFRFWAKKMFTLSTTPTHHVVCHSGKPVATKECLYDVLVYCHRKSSHGGRDKTSAEVRQHYSWVPKELIARFVKHCPLCLSRRSIQQRQGSSNNAVTLPTLSGLDLMNSSSLSTIRDAPSASSLPISLPLPFPMAPQDPSQIQDQPPHKQNLHREALPSLLQQSSVQITCSTGMHKDMSNSIAVHHSPPLGDSRRLDSRMSDNNNGDDGSSSHDDDSEKAEGDSLDEDLCQRQQCPDQYLQHPVLENSDEQSSGMVGISLRHLNLVPEAHARKGNHPPQRLKQVQQQMYSRSHPSLALFQFPTSNGNESAAITHYHQQHQHQHKQAIPYNPPMPIVPVVVHPNGHILHDRHPIHNRARILGLATSVAGAATATIGVHMSSNNGSVSPFQQHQFHQNHHYYNRVQPPVLYYGAQGFNADVSEDDEDNGDDGGEEEEQAERGTGQQDLRSGCQYYHNHPHHHAASSTSTSV